MGSQDPTQPLAKWKFDMSGKEISGITQHAPS
ncbi:uncharacterized protein G2W53_021137 [Senna tora]|uniref:Uncharacterized protein n=1 Tax=Senna tora TaxID=362788 RepID=A0A834WJA7_9FABA|nr:uncharacterized protein G2W53_021137 [Senna tora]